MTLPKIWQIVYVLVISSPRIFSANVCSRVENYTITTMETYTEPVVVNTFTWCLQIPPRCPKTRTEMRQRYRVKSKTMIRNVNECCEGYTEKPIGNDPENGVRCVAFCKNCLMGICVSPNKCQCHPGYLGDNCSHVCPPGKWGPRCVHPCDCSHTTLCDPENGDCRCPSGFRGKTCNESCPSDRWGPGCTIPCDCNTSRNICHPVTGKCAEIDISTENAAVLYSESSTETTGREISSAGIIDGGKESSRVSEIIEQTTESRSNVVLDDSLNYTEEGRQTSAATDYASKTTDPETTRRISTSVRIGTPTPEDDASSTARPMIVLVSVPERRRNSENDRPKFTLKNPFLRRFDDDVNLRDMASPKTDYVKTIHKDVVHPAPISLDIALIVVASVVSLGLTSVAVVMVLHMRSKLFEGGRMSIYEEPKAKHPENDGGTGRISTIVNASLPQSPIRMSHLFTSSPEPGTILTIDGIEPSCNYANGAATIGLRISGNLRDFLQDDHYDRPPATLVRLQTEFDANTEHVYDEIPLQPTPLSTRKNA